MILSEGKFTVSLLTQEVPFDYFKRFGFQSGRDVDKFDGFDACARGENGIYYITKYTNAYISGKVISTLDLTLCLSLTSPQPKFWTRFRL